ncbi:MAG TPA: DUF502 domain-containing protein [Opitutaceae bacterium]|nr:DUF502 domain-containing protein [Opitutaceae bacterium]
MAESRLITLRNAFISGLLLLAPIAVTWVVFRWLVDTVGGTFRKFVIFFAPESVVAWLENIADHQTWGIVWDVIATVIVIVLVTLLGLLSRLFLGKFILQGAERLVQGIPGISAVYNTVKQIVDTFSSQNRNVFSKVVLVQFPRAGMHSIGFLTSKAQGEPQVRTAEEVWTVFVPTTPNPTTGFLIMLPKSEIIELEMSVGDGMKMVISGGSVVPPWPPPSPESPAANPPAGNPAG